MRDGEGVVDKDKENSSPVTPTYANVRDSRNDGREKFVLRS